MEQELNKRKDALPKKGKHAIVLTVAYSCIIVAVVTIFVLFLYLANKNSVLESENESLRVAATSTEPNEEPEVLQLSFEGGSFDPCGFMYDNYVFDKTPNHFISGLKKGIDYSMSDDLFKSMGLYTYIIYPKHEYMGVKSDKTAIGFVAETEKSDINSIVYFFDIDKDNAKQVLNAIHRDVSKQCGDYISCAGEYEYVKRKSILDEDFSLFDDSEKEVISVDEAIEFERLVRCVTNSLRGVYYVQWAVKGYEITLNVNTDTKSSTFEGNLSIATIT